MIQYICNLCGKEVAKDELVSLWKQETKTSPYTHDDVLEGEELHFHSECWGALMLVTKGKIEKFAGE